MTALAPTTTERIKLWLVETKWLPAWLHLRWKSAWVSALFAELDQSNSKRSDV
jgi:hypothetical protein